MEGYGRVLKVVNELNLENLSTLDHEAIKRRIWMLAALDGWANKAAIPFHRKLPICPYRATRLDGIGNMKEGVDSYGAC